MAKVVVIGIPGEPGLWLADLGNGTVRPLDQVTGDLATANKLRAQGGRSSRMSTSQWLCPPPTRCFRVISTGDRSRHRGWGRLAQ